MNKFKHFVNTQLAGLDDVAFIRLLKIFTGAAAIIIAYAFIFSGFQIVDEFEHLHASWLVSIGKFPYKDFFEHHNPLLWYVSAPIVRLFYDHAIIFYVMRLISAGASVITCFYIYRIPLFWGDKKCSWFAVVLYLGNLVSLYCFYQYRPDTYMNLCFVAGVYYLFQALKTDKLKFLTMSFLCLTFSFLFLQKIAFLLIIIALIILYLLCRNKLQWKKTFLATLPSFFVLILSTLFLMQKGILLDYYALNYPFNKALVSYFVRGSFWYSNIFYTIYIISFLSVLYLYRKENLYFKIIAVLFVAEFLMRCLYFAPHTHYYSLLTILSSIVLSLSAEKMLNKCRPIIFLLIIGLFLNLGWLFNQIDRSIENHNSYKHYLMADWVHKNSQPDDSLMNGYDVIFNIYRPDTSYYWFGLDLLLPIMEKEYNLAHKTDVNELIISQHPKFVYAANYPDLMAARYYGENKFSQQFIPELIRALYKPTPFEGLWELK